MATQEDLQRLERQNRQLQRQLEQLQRQQRAMDRRVPPATTRSHALAVAPQAVTATSILPESPETRFLDAAVTAAVASATVLWTATRPSTTALTWAAFWMGLGALMFIEGRGELKYGGAGVMSANAVYLTLRLFQLVKVNP